MVRYSSNCEFGATDNAEGFCFNIDANSICERTEHGEVHVGNHDKNCHVGCKVAGVLPLPSPKGGKHRRPKR